MFYLAGLLLSISLFHAWRYSKTSIDPDWSYFNLWGFTGSVYGRDFADCKTPLIHLWYLGLSKIVGRSIPRVRFANHFLIGSAGTLLFLLTGNFPASLAYTVMVNSGWLLAFHGNVSQIPAALIALAFVSGDSPPLALLLWTLAVLFEPKLLPSFVILYWYVVPAFAAAGVAAYIVFKNRKWFCWLWESSVTIPARMARNRRGDFYRAWMPWFTSNGSLYILPWLVFAVLAKPDIWYWLPAAAYLAFIASGKIVRQNHLIPLIPFIAFSGMDSLAPGASAGVIPLLALVDFASAGFYFGNVWARFYSALEEVNDEAEKVGRWLRDRAGTVYVNGIHSGVYIHAGRPILYGFAEQIEIRETAHERRKQMIEGWRSAPPDWVVTGKIPGITFKPVGYQRMAIVGESTIYKRSGPMGTGRDT